MQYISYYYYTSLTAGMSNHFELYYREVEGIRQRGCLKKTWWDCVKNDMESLGLSQKDVLSRNKWRRRIKGATG